MHAVINALYGASFYITSFRESTLAFLSFSYHHIFDRRRVTSLEVTQEAKSLDITLVHRTQRPPVRYPVSPECADL